MRPPALNFSLTLLVIGIAATGCERGRADQSDAPRPLEVGSRVDIGFRQWASGRMPNRLSRIGLFTDVATLSPAPGVVAYDVIVPFWSDGAHKRRWMALPPGKAISFSPDGEWAFPPGTVFVKHFELVAAQEEASARWVEIRVLVCDGAGGIAGASYRWRDDHSDADLVEDSLVASIGPAPTDRWYIPGPQDCRTCHTAGSGGVLGVKTRQINRPFGIAGENQLNQWSRAGYFDAPSAALSEPELLARLSRLDDPAQSLTDRVRSYLDVNCANCHRPGGVAGNFDSRFDTPMSRQNFIDGPVLINLGIDHARAIAPADVWRSIALVRVETSDRTRMPPLGHEKVDEQGARLLREWIESLPGRRVLPPPVIEPGGGEFRQPVRVKIRANDPDAVIHYTLDGSLPFKSSPVYSAGIQLDNPTTVRARVFKEGMTPSICVQETFVVNP
jgi:uncharacterized repeat protein (TIGR03806 family)